MHKVTFCCSLLFCDQHNFFLNVIWINVLRKACILKLTEESITYYCCAPDPNHIFRLLVGRNNKILELIFPRYHINQCYIAIICSSIQKKDNIILTFHNFSSFESFFSSVRTKQKYKIIFKDTYQFFIFVVYREQKIMSFI